MRMLLSAFWWSRRLKKQERLQRVLIRHLISYIGAKNPQIIPTVDAVPVVRCKECRFWMPEHIERDDGSIMLYEQLPWMEPGMAPIEFGVNVGSYCTLYENVITHGFRDGKRSLDCTRLWRSENDYCSRGERRDESADVRKKKGAAR